MNTLLSQDVGLTPADVARFVKALQMRATDFATAWGLGAPIVSSTCAKPDMVIKLTEQHRHTGAKGYHVVENGIPTAYCSLNAHAKKIWGTYHAPIMSRGKVLFPARYVDGLVTTAIHELVEALTDPLIKTLSEPDGNSHQWLVEPADPVDGIFDVRVIDDKNVVMCDFVFPNFYQLGSTGPWDFAGAVKAPFTIPVKSGYGYWKSLIGGFVKI